MCSCMMGDQFSTSAPSAPVAELTENSGARVRRVRWIADSTYALNVAAQKCKVGANAAMANHARGAWTRVL